MGEPKIPSQMSVEEYRHYIKTGSMPAPSLFGDEVMSDMKQPTMVNNKAFVPIYNKLEQLRKEKRCIFIRGNVPSSKNSKEIIQMPMKKGEFRITGKCHCGAAIKSTTRPILINSKVVRNYIKTTEPGYVSNRLMFHTMMLEKELPMSLGLYFIRDSKRRFDINNATQIIQDLMVEYKWIEDDNMDFVYPIPLGNHTDPTSAGVYIAVLNNSFKSEIINYL